jgi:hypothetical protein
LTNEKIETKFQFLELFQIKQIIIKRIGIELKGTRSLRADLKNQKALCQN